LLDELEATKSQFADCQNEVVRVKELADRVQAEKTKLTRRISKLIHNGKSIDSKNSFLS